MSKLFAPASFKVKMLSRLEQLLDRDCPHEVAELRFLQASHNATVFRGMLDGQEAYFKWYDTDIVPKLTGRAVDEIRAVSARMAGFDGGVAQLLWASVPQGVIAISACPGAALEQALTEANMGQVMRGAGRWLRAYMGDTITHNQFSTAYWLRQRQGLDLTRLEGTDRSEAAALLELQQARQSAMGTVPAWKGEMPQDFAPQNLNWAGNAVWGFDLEGHKIVSVAQVMARFAVLVLERVDTGDWDHAPRVHDMVRHLQQGGADCSDGADLIDFVTGDALLDRFVKWADHDVILPRLRRAVLQHLDAA